MKLIIDNVEELDLVPARTRPVDGFRAVQMQHDFQVVGSGGVVVEGEAGDYLVVQPDGTLAVATEAAFQAGFSRVLGRRVRAYSAPAAETSDAA